MPSSRLTPGRSHPRRTLITKALFEKFTERSIKAVMLAQEFSRAIGSAEVCLGVIWAVIWVAYYEGWEEASDGVGRGGHQPRLECPSPPW